MILALFSCRAETYEEVTVDCMPAADTVIMNQTYIDRDILMPLRIFVADEMLVVCQDKSEHLFTVSDFRLTDMALPQDMRGEDRMNLLISMSGA